MSASTHKIEPTAPSIELWRGRPAPAKADLVGANPAQRRQEEQSKQRIEQERELEQKLKSSAVKRLPEHVAIDVVAELDAQLARLETAAQAFERDFGRPNEPLLAAKQLVADLESKLTIARQELAAIESLGDSVDRLKAAIQMAEHLLLALHSAASNEIGQSLIDERLGSGVPWARVPDHIRQEIRLHRRLRGLSEINPISSLSRIGNPTKEQLLNAMDIAGTKLTALRDYGSRTKRKAITCGSTCWSGLTIR
jgi:hypothetical protein